MGMLDTIRTAWRLGETKAATVVTPSNFQPLTSYLPWTWMPRTAMDLSGIGDGSANSAVFGLLSYKARKFAEAVPRVFERVEKQDDEVAAHPASELIAAPNPYMVGQLLQTYITTAVDVAGDGYIFKARSAAGRVVQLWPLMPSYVEPRGDDGPLATDADAGKLIAYYEYSPQGQPMRLEPEDVIHFRMMLDPTNHRKGASPLQTVLREVLTDEEAALFSATLLTNIGVPGVIISPKEAGDPGPDPKTELPAMLDDFKEKFGGSRRGEPLFLRGGAVDVHVVSLTPEQMDFKGLRRVPEERFASVLGVPAGLAQLGAGLDRATYSNLATMRESFTEDTLVPIWSVYGAQWTVGLLRDFDENPARRIGYDVSDVRALQPDQDALWKRLDVGVKGGWVLVADAKRAVGLEVYDGDDVYLRSVNTVEIPYDQQGQAPVLPPPDTNA